MHTKSIILLVTLTLLLSQPSFSQDPTWGRFEYISRAEYGLRIAMDSPWKVFEFSPFSTSFIKGRTDGVFRVSLNSVFCLPFVLYAMSSDTTTSSLEEIAAILFIIPQSIANSRIRVPFGTESLYLAVGFNTDLYNLDKLKIYSEFFMGVQWRLSRVAFQIQQTIPIIKVPVLDKGLSISGSLSLYLFSV
jgi:hypothetical protein